MDEKYDTQHPSVKLMVARLDQWLFLRDSFFKKLINAIVHGLFQVAVTHGYAYFKM